MTQQTLREEIAETFPELETDLIDAGYDSEQVFGTFLARFKEFAEKELIGEDEEEFRRCMCKGCCVHDNQNPRNALRNEQREKLAEYFK